MKSFSTRSLDELGRIVLPMELRKKHQFETGTHLEIGVDDSGQIVLRKFRPYCKICGSEGDLSAITGTKHSICTSCKASIQTME